MATSQDLHKKARSSWHTAYTGFSWQMSHFATGSSDVNDTLVDEDAPCTLRGPYREGRVREKEEGQCRLATRPSGRPFAVEPRTKHCTFVTRW